VTDPHIRPTPLKPGTDAPEDTIEAVLRRLGHGAPDERVTLGELVASLDHRAYGFVILLLAVPNLTPGPSLPGFSTVFGIAAIVVAVEMTLGRTQPSLPRFLARISVGRARLAGMIARALPLIVRIDRILRPRLTAVWRVGGHRWTGLAALLQAVLLALPVPVYSMAPACALLLMALGLIARDGAALALGHLAGLASFGLAVALAVAAAQLLGW
jgi:hypothetical protein